MWRCRRKAAKASARGLRASPIAATAEEALDATAEKAEFVAPALPVPNRGSRIAALSTIFSTISAKSRSIAWKVIAWPDCQE